MSGYSALRRSSLVRLMAGGVAALLVSTLMSADVASFRQDPGPGSPNGSAAGPPSARPDTRIGELPERRTASATTRRNPDGSMTTTVASVPVNYRAPDGSMQPIDSNLHRTDQDGYAWSSGANAFQMLFKPVAGPDFAEFRIGGHRLRLRAEGTAGASPARVSGGQITYPGAFAGADLRYQVGPVGVNKIIDLAGPQSPTSYTFRLSSPSDSPPPAVQARPDGSYALLLPRMDVPALVLAAPTVQEAADPQEVSAPDPAAKPRLRVVTHGHDIVVTLGLDAGWLRAPGRRFPVQLDPTIMIQPDVEDANFTPLSNYLPWINERLYIGGDSTYNWRAALQFDLGSVPVDAQVTSAQLGLYFDGWCVSASGPFCGGVSHQMDVYRLTSPWTTASTFGQLTTDPTVAGSYTLPATLPQGWMQWPITTMVSQWLTGAQPNYGLIVRRRTEALNSSGPTALGRRFAAAPALQPKLDITYTSDGVDLLEPATLHSNGADLAWTAYTGPSGAPFDRYEVHRSASTTFTPSAATLLTTIRDRTITSYRDTTAAANRTFTYKIVANTSVSNPWTVTLPAAGQASKVLQPGPVEGRNTFLYYDTGVVNCLNYGTDTGAYVGTTPDRRYRDLLSFDLRDIPANASISAATMSLWVSYGANVPMTIEAHRVLRPWKEGTGNPPCATGATWYETEGGQPWTTPGGDIDQQVAASVSVPAGQSGVFHNFTVTGLVQSWANGTANNGLVLRAADETLKADNALVYATDDFSASPALRPKLTVSYADGSVPQGPQVSLAAPGPNAVVSGSAVKLAAAAGDDRRVDLAEFLVGTTVVGTDTTAPFEITWNSASVANGTASVTVRATDDAGNVTTSAPVSLTVDNSAPPTGSLTAPASGATVSGPVTVSATASDDRGVASVAFLVDGVQVGAPVTASPYTIAWNTQDPLTGFYNGSHTISAVVTDTSGQQTVTAGRTVTVNNTATSSAVVGYSISGAATLEEAYPPMMTENTAAGIPIQDPYAGTVRADGTSGGSLNRALADVPHDDAGTPPAGCPAIAYCPTVTVSNKSGTTWRDSTAQVWYRWYAPNGAVMFEGKSPAAFPATFGKNATQAFPLVIYPPALPPGAAQGTYRLRIDVYDPATGTWFAAKGNPPVDNPVIVAKVLATKLGLERYYQYDAEPVGAGMSALTNVANGNSLLRWTPFFAPGRGLSTMVDLTYNSLEDHSKSPVGNNFSLSMSGLIRFGEPMDIHPNKADAISGRSDKWVELTDGDGTTHRFTNGVTGVDGITRFTEPPGVNLYLRSLPTTDPNGRWALTRPDKVTFYFDVDGFPLSVQDRNGNKISFTFEDTPAGEDPGGPKKRITKVTDAGGRSFTIDYWSKAEAKKAHVRGNIQTIADHDGSRLDFDYYDDGNLLRLTQRGGTKATGEFLADRSFVFTYTTSNGAGPAIPLLADRANPDPKTPNQSTRLYSVRDPRATETTYAYYLAPDGAQLRWKLKTRTNRDGQNTGYGYDLTNQVTTVTAPLARVTKYGYDTTGKVTTITNPLDQITSVEWTPDFKVSKVTEPSTKFSTYTYNNNGYPTSQTNQAGEQTLITYFDSGVDAYDTGLHLSQLATVTRPKGTATPTAGDFQWSYSYDSAGNVDKVTDPTGAVTNYDFNLAGSANPGTIAQIFDANGNPPTTFPSYDPSGQPTEIKDPLGKSTKFGYGVDGQLLWLQDPNHAGDSGTDERAYKSFFDYDSFGRLGRQSAPRSTATDRGNLIWSSADFDPNDNVTRQVQPHYGRVDGDDTTNAPAAIATFDVMDRLLLASNPDTSVDPAGERTRMTYDAAGRLIKQEQPKGVLSATVDDFATVTTYDPLDRVVRETVYGTDTSTGQTRYTHLCYDVAGDLRSVTSPRAGLATVTCPGNGPATVGFTATYTYDAAHRQLTTTDPLSHQKRTAYDANGNVSTSEGDIDTATGRKGVTTIFYDQRDKPVKTVQRFDGTTRDVTSLTEYDRNGNVSKVISPRGFDTKPFDPLAGGASPYDATSFYVTFYSYDAVNRKVRVELPHDARDGTERQYVHNAYDPNGNLAWTSLPVTSSAASSVQDTARTVMTYFDPGWIRTSDDPTNPKVVFDYTAEGWQAQRTPERKSAPGTPDVSQTMLWTYFADGQLKSRTDNGGQQSTYTYDVNNNLLTGTDGGVADTTEAAMDITASYTGFNEPLKVRQKKKNASVWTFSDYVYDPNGNVTQRRENGEEDAGGTQSKAPRTYTMTYDGADWLASQLDLGTDSACKDDQRIVNTFWGTGAEKQRDIYRAASGCVADPTTWPKKQTTNWTHFDNGQLRTLVTKNGSGTTTESHDVTYLDAGMYINGNRVTDHYVLTRADTATGATTCLASAPCDAKYTYDARDRLLTHQLRSGRTDTYTLDEPAKLLGDTSIRGGSVTTEVKNGVTTTKKYRASQLTEITSGGVTGKYWYDDFGNIDCLTLAAGTQADCSPSDGATPSANLITDYAYDYLQRLQGMNQYAGGTRTDHTTYANDALDRVSTEVEDHTGTGNDRTTTFTYQGMSNQTTEEKQTGGTNPRTKTFSYDSYGHRLSMTDTATGSTAEPDKYTYSHDVHSSVSQLINDTGQVKASYGYDAYGGADAPSSDPQALTTGDTNNLAPTNPYRYTSRRMDSGTASSNSTPSPVPNGSAGYDMGARRYGPDTGAFLQQDMYAGALSNLGLSLDPLTQNRYALAGGNPISYIETDGHNALSDWLSDAGDEIKEDWNSFQRAIGEGPNGFADSPSWLRGPLQTWDDLDNASFTSIGTPKAERDAATDRLANSKFGEFTGITDARKCDKGDGGACAWAAASVLPFGLGKAGRAVSAIARPFGEKATLKVANLIARVAPVRSKPGAIFYSGPGGALAAKGTALATGKDIIDNFVGARLLTKLIPYSRFGSAADGPWTMLSDRFARQASGDVTAFVMHASPSRVFAQTELPALMDNAAVTSINNLAKSDFYNWFWATR
jgi:YD repeat-containing protein